MPDTSTISERYARAVTYSAGIHATYHFVGAADPRDLLAVSALVLQAGGDEDLAIAGLLHDSVEKCGGQQRLADVRRRFGDRVADAVQGSSDTVSEPWQVNMADGELAQSRLDQLALADPDVSLVRLAVIAQQAQQHCVELRSGAEARADLIEYFAACLSIAEQRNAPQAVVTPLALAVRSLHSLLP